MSIVLWKIILVSSANEWKLREIREHGDLVMSGYIWLSTPDMGPTLYDANISGAIGGLKLLKQMRRLLNNKIAYYPVVALHLVFT